MILISTIRKLLAYNPKATVCRLTIATHTLHVDHQCVTVPETVDYFATERAANAEWMRRADIMRLCGIDPAVLCSMVDVPANEAAKALGFDFSQTIAGV